MSSAPSVVESATSAPETSAPPTSSAAPPPPTSTAPRTSSAAPPPTSQAPTTTAAAPPPSSTNIILITSVVTQTPTAPGASTQPPSIVIVTSTAPNSLQSSTLIASTSRSKTSSAAPLPTSDGQAATKTGGLTEKGKIAVAVVVPIVAIAAIIVGLLFFWKKRKARKSAEEQRGKEMEEYGFNPNNDPTIPPVSAAYGDNKAEDTEDGVGYRGWGATNSSTGRGPSTNPGRSPAIGTALSDGGSNGHGPHADRRSDRHSTDPIVVSGPGGRPPTGESDVGALGTAPVTNFSRQPGVHRGTSNASSAYSTGPPQSEASDDVHGAARPGGYHHEDNPYYNDPQGQAGPYADNNYGAPQPIIRDVQARRNTRIEKPTVYPQQGNTGISQNF